MAKKHVAKINLKATLTEHNAVWNSVALHDELVKEHRSLHDDDGTPTEDSDLA